MRIRDICLLALLGIGAAHAQSPNDYAARWPLQVAGDSPAWQLEISEEVFAVLQDPGFGDLQVFNAAGAVVPMARATTATAQAPRWLQARFANGGPADGAAGDAGVMSYAYVVPAQLTVEAARVALGTAAPAANLALQYQLGDSWNTAARLSATSVGAEAVGAATAGADTNEVHFPQALTAQAWRMRSGMVLTPAPTLHLAYRPVRFVFLAQGPGPYTLAAGSASSRRSEQALSAELTRLRDAGAQLPVATLGPRTTASFAAAPAVVPAAGPWWPWLVGAALGLAALLGGFAWRRRRHAAA